MISSLMILIEIIMHLLDIIKSMHLRDIMSLLMTQIMNVRMLTRLLKCWLIYLTRNGVSDWLKAWRRNISSIIDVCFCNIFSLQHLDNSFVFSILSRRFYRMYIIGTVRSVHCPILWWNWILYTLVFDVTRTW